MANQRVIEFLIGIVFLIGLILIVVLTLNISNSSYSKKSSLNSNQPITINNYYSYENKDYPKTSPTGNVVYKYDNKEYVVYKKCDSCCCEWEKYLDKKEHYKVHRDSYSSYGKHRKIKQRINYLDEYLVVVKNHDNVGKYFQVIYYFENNDGNEYSEKRVKYVNPGESVEFLYRDSHFEKDDYESWTYDVFSQDKGFI